MIDVKNVSKEYTKGKPVIEDVSFSVAVNQVCCLLGKNVAGKSIIINIISQSIRQSKGEVHLNGKAVNLNLAQQRDFFLLFRSYLLLLVVPMIADVVLSLGFAMAGRVSLMAFAAFYLLSPPLPFLRA